MARNFCQIITEKYMNYLFARVISFFIYTKTYAKPRIIFLVAVKFVSELKLIGPLLYASPFPIQSLWL
jgi:hypothetical protein